MQKKIIWRRISLFALVAVLCFQLIVSAFPTVVRAEGEKSVDISETNPLTDLTNAVLNGEKFSLENYKFDSAKKIQMLAFAEHGYSIQPGRENEFEYYVYVYNPEGLTLYPYYETNNIKMAFSETEPFSRYPLSYVSATTQEKIEGLLYKFKVELTKEEKTVIRAKLKSSERFYRISELELATKGKSSVETVAVTVATDFYYRGFMGGYGDAVFADSTITCRTRTSEHLSLDVRSTFYRPEGTKEGNTKIQDTLHSVYFAVPNDKIISGSELIKVHARWKNATLQPGIVTGNKAVYDKMKDFVGVNIGELSQDLYWGYCSDYEEKTTGGLVPHMYFSVDYAYNWYEQDYTFHDVTVARRIPTLYFLFGTDTFSENSADDYTVASSDILATMKNSIRYGGDLVEEKYSSSIFSSVDSNFTDVNIEASKEYSLESAVVTKEWWNHIFGGSTTVTETFNGIKAIQKVQDSDFSGSVEENCKKLFISESDYEDFKAYYNANKKTSAIYLFRYRVSEYMAEEATLCRYNSPTESSGLCDSTGKLQNKHYADTNAYFFQQSVDLGFDIIDLTYKLGAQETVIPVVMSPEDIVHDATPPVYTEENKDPDWWQKLVMILMLIVLLVILSPILTPLLTVVLNLLITIFGKAFGAIGGFLWKVITAPVRFFVWLFRRR